MYWFGNGVSDAIWHNAHGPKMRSISYWYWKEWSARIIQGSVYINSLFLLDFCCYCRWVWEWFLLLLRLRWWFPTIFRYKDENHQSHLLSPATYIHIAYCCVQSTSFKVAQCDDLNCVYRCVFLSFLCVCVFAHRSRLNVWRFERIKDLVQFCVNSFEREQNACFVDLFGYEITKYKA